MKFPTGSCQVDLLSRKSWNACVDGLFASVYTSVRGRMGSVASYAQAGLPIRLFSTILSPNSFSNEVTIHGAADNKILTSLTAFRPRKQAKG